MESARQSGIRRGQTSQTLTRLWRHVTQPRRSLVWNLLRLYSRTLESGPFMDSTRNLPSIVDAGWVFGAEGVEFLAWVFPEWANDVNDLPDFEPHG